MKNNRKGHQQTLLGGNMISQKYRQIAPTPRGSILHHTKLSQKPYNQKKHFFSEKRPYLVISIFFPRRLVILSLELFEFSEIRSFARPLALGSGAVKQWQGSTAQAASGQCHGRTKARPWQYDRAKAEPWQCNGAEKPMPPAAISKPWQCQARPTALPWLSRHRHCTTMALL